MLIQAFLPATLSTVEYPLQLLHSPPAPVVKRPGALAPHHPLQVQGSHKGLPTFSWGLWGLSLLFLCFLSFPVLCMLVIPQPPPTMSPCVPSVSQWWCWSLAFHPLTFWVPLTPHQEPSQPLNLTAKPKAPDLPSTASSPSLKLSNCGPRPPSHGAPTRDLQSSAPNLPLGESWPQRPSHWLLWGGRGFYKMSLGEVFAPFGFSAMSQDTPFLLLPHLLAPQHHSSPAQSPGLLELLHSSPANSAPLGCAGSAKSRPGEEGC